MSRAILGALIVGLGAACAAPGRSSAERSMGAPTQTPGDADASRLAELLVAKHGEGQRARAQRGVAQVLALWRAEDGAVEPFLQQQFVGAPEALDGTFARLESVFEQLDGSFLEAGRTLRWASDVDGPLEPVDGLLATVDPGAHLSEDLFQTQVAFAALLNFPLTSLDERLRDGPRYDRRRWAEVRLTGRFRARVPGSVRQREAEVAAKAELYISQYNLQMHHVLDGTGRRLFPKGLRLISHWNLRDELKASYARPGAEGLDRQRLIVQVMNRIVTQSIPAAVIDNPALDWNPWTNEVMPAPVAEREPDAGASPRPAASNAPEPDTRYAHLLEHFHAAREADKHSPIAPTALARAFEAAEIPEARLTALLTQVLESPLAAQVAAKIRERLGRPLEPQDLWYDGFNPRSSMPEERLTALTEKRYPTADAFAKDIPRLLGALGFAKERARFVAERIRVDPSRGAGHAMPAGRRGDFPRLRTRVGPRGMDYKGYNVAVHELGHNVEQVLSLYAVDHTLLAGVPNTAFTEALAFVFQARDLELLGQVKPDVESDRLRVLNTFWQTWEIAGVALVDLATWKWMYAHPDATPAQLREAVVAVARDVWNRHYAPLLGGKDIPLLAVYSHMISVPLYLFNYPLGHLIAFQVEEHLRATRNVPLGVEFERMVTLGAVTPDVWMQNATGAPVSADALLKATERALTGPR